MRHARLDVVNKTEDSRRVVTEDRRRQAILAVVRDLHRPLKIFHPQHRQHWSKDLFACDTHVWSYMIEDSRANEVTFIEPVTGCTRAAAHKRGAVFTPNVDVFKNCIELALIDTRTHLRCRIRSGTNPHRLRTFRQPLDKLVSNLVHHDRATRRRATLPGGSESALCCRFDGQLHVGVFEDYDGILSTHLALDLGAASRRLFVKTNADAV